MTASLNINGKLIESNGRSIDVTFATIYKWKDGKVVEQRSFLDETTLLKPLDFH